MTTKITVSEAATASGLNPSSIRRAIARGDLQAERYGKTYVIEPAEFQRWLDNPLAHKTGRK